MHVIAVNQRTDKFGDGIAASDILAAPTVKNEQGKLSRNPIKEEVDKHLLFQKTLQEYLESIQRKQ
ncbi:hypothetical protein KKG83_03655 [Candidatus Micrarchaeota archaeon]|nr:hypothetical protein [Candidatus Micrarchaeota archaeon]MBU2476540.1 hypothetical protein [Candidatus Micrarchaeota archaeon]